MLMLVAYILMNCTVHSFVCQRIQLKRYSVSSSHEFCSISKIKAFFRYKPMTGEAYRSYARKTPNSTVYMGFNTITMGGSGTIYYFQCMGKN
jgi:hypothetical protein